MTIEIIVLLMSHHVQVHLRPICLIYLIRKKFDTNANFFARATCSANFLLSQNVISSTVAFSSLKFSLDGYINTLTNFNVDKPCCFCLNSKWTTIRFLTSYFLQYTEDPVDRIVTKTSEQDFQTFLYSIARLFTAY